VPLLLVIATFFLENFEEVTLNMAIHAADSVIWKIPSDLAPRIGEARWLLGSKQGTIPLEHPVGYGEGKRCRLRFLNTDTASYSVF
jgi:hypothetical protein